MTAIEIRLQEILNEDDQRDKISKFLLSKPTIKSTYIFAADKNFKTDKTLKVFKKSKLTMFGGLVLIGMLLFGISIYVLKQKEVNQGWLAFAAILILVLIINFLNQFFYDDKLNFTIYIDNEGIQIDTTLFTWQEIKETAVLNYHGKNGGLSKLVILLQDDSYKVYELTNFYSFIGIEKSISNYVEFFKPKTSPNIGFGIIGA